MQTTSHGQQSLNKLLHHHRRPPLPFRLSGAAGLSLALLFAQGYASGAPSSRSTTSGAKHRTLSSQASFTVTSLQDSGSGSLREILNKANQSGPTSTIQFKLSTDNPIIRLRSPLPTLRTSIKLIGFNGGNPNQPVQLYGQEAGAGSNGLVIAAAGSRIQGLMIVNFPGHGIVIAASGVVIEGCFIGTNASGKARLGNGQDGIYVEPGVSNCQVVNNLIAFNKRTGVNLPNGQPPPVKIRLKRNLIYNNRKMAVDLGNDGPTHNDSHQKDPNGPNQWRNTPVLQANDANRGIRPKRSLNWVGTPTNSLAQRTTVTVTGQFSDAKLPSQTVTLDFYLGSSCPSTATDMDEILFIPMWIGTELVKTDGFGRSASYRFPFSLQHPVSGGFVNSMATDAAGNSSEYSNCVGVTTQVAQNRAEPWQITRSFGAAPLRRNH